MAAAVVTWGLPEEEVVGKQDGTGCNWAVWVAEVYVVGKQDGAGCNWAFGVPEEDVVGKHDGAGLGYTAAKGNSPKPKIQKMGWFSGSTPKGVPGG